MVIKYETVFSLSMSICRRRKTAGGVVLYFAVLMVFFLQAMSADGQHRFEIPYSANNIDVYSYRNGFILNVIEDCFYIQDLIAGKLVVAKRQSPEKADLIDFPESLISLCLADEGAFALTRSGVARFNNISELLACLKDGRLGQEKLLVLKGAELGLKNNDYRLFIDSADNYALWNRPENRLLIFDRTGKLICDYPCSSRPQFTDRNSFLSVFFSPQFGSKIMEIAYEKAVKDGQQIENDALFVDVRGNRQFILMNYNASETSFTGILRPGSEQIMPPVMYVKVNKNSTIEKIADLPDDFWQDELCLGSGTCLCLQPQYHMPDKRENQQGGPQISKLIVHSFSCPYP